jgi:predicted nucleotidyltransferase
MFGSFAREKEKARSDIDLIIIGDIRMREVSKLLSGLQEKVGREINPHLFKEEEFEKRIQEKEHFVSSVMNKDVKVIIGNIDEYR